MCAASDNRTGGFSGGLSGEAGGITEVLLALGEGDPEAMNRLLDAVYAELHRMCLKRLAGDAAVRIVQPTELVHEVYLRLVDQSRVSWRNRAHFFAVAGRIIRRVLIDQVRAARRVKRGGDRHAVPLTLTIVGDGGPDLDLLALEEALEALAAVDEMAVRVVEMRFFAGQSHEEIAYVLDLSERSVRRSWNFAKAWLFRRMGEHRGDTPPPETADR